MQLIIAPVKTSMPAITEQQLCVLLRDAYRALKVQRFFVPAVRPIVFYMQLTG
jgi:hypothetical protein